jgi:hypothetical protein
MTQKIALGHGSRSWTLVAIVLMLLAGAYGGFEYRRWNAKEPGAQPGVAAPVATDSGAEVHLRFDQPIESGPYPVNGLSIKQLIERMPLFPPIEGLDETLWKKTCSSCHKWDKERLCNQGKTYAKTARYVLRQPHPYGGSFKVALMRWAKSGCE